LVFDSIHSLITQDASVEDSGEYSCHVEAGEEVMEASVFVEVVGEEPTVDSVMTSTVLNAEVLGITDSVDQLEATVNLIEEDAQVTEIDSTTPSEEIHEVRYL